jgi:GTPase SAR1 family protein
VISSDLKGTLSKISDLDYLVWKDIGNVKESLYRNNDIELDIMVSEDHTSVLLDRLHEEGYLGSINIIPEYLKKIYHFLKFTPTGYIHFHIYPSFLSGNHFSKEFYLDLPNFYSHYDLFNNLKVATPRLESFYSSLRYHMKAQSGLENIKLSDKENFNSFLEHNDDFSAHYQEIINNIDAYRYKSHMKVKLENFYYKFCYRLYCKITKRNNKFMLSNLKIAFVGTDGSGKTTICTSIYKNIKRKLPVIHVYLGSNNRNYSTKTWFLYICYKLFFRFFKITNLQYIYWRGLAAFEISRLNDTYNRYIKTNSDGFIVIYERFPIPGFLDFPNKVVNNGEPYITNKQLKKINDYKIFWESESEKVKTMLITTPFKIMASRRNLDKNEYTDIFEKKKIEASFLNGSSINLNVIENNGSLDNTLDKIYELL